ncbi:hypothetical protein [Persicobacter sp. CCB-QB2]|uniref:hypothetical protein n=1 Tax=Persicobacter sp. CCB-QB2 TaxID=1561025 RepID=UPI0006A9819D|nr:hypothetical protein [Persicobacter sp. CCB-QB2]
MADAKRIYELEDEEFSPHSNDYAMIDRVGTTTRKVKVENLAATKNLSNVPVSDFRNKATNAGVGVTAQDHTFNIDVGAIKAGDTVPSGLSFDDWVALVGTEIFPPVAAISGGGVHEYTGAATVPITLNWSVTKGSLNITNILVAGESIPPTGGNQSGTKPVNAPANTSTSYSITVTDEQGQQDTKSTTVSFRHRRFFFADSDDLQAMSDTEISNRMNASHLSRSELATNRLKSYSQPCADEYFYYAYPAAWAKATFRVNGLINNAVIEKEFQYTNQNGHTETYYLYRSFGKNSSTLSIEVI